LHELTREEIKPPRQRDVAPIIKMRLLQLCGSDAAAVLQRGCGKKRNRNDVEVLADGQRDAAPNNKKRIYIFSDTKN
jgi:hypothetical protein